MITHLEPDILELEVKWALGSITMNKASGSDRFKVLDLLDNVPEELWTEVHNIVQEVVIKPFPRKRNAKRQNGFLRRPYK